MSEKVECTIVLRLTFDPKMDEVEDIRYRIEDAIQDMIKHGHLEGCEHGAQLESHKLDMAVSKVY